MLIRLVQPFTDLVRWGEPYVFDDEDPLLDSGPCRSDDSFNLWA